MFWCILIGNPTVSSMPLITVITAQTTLALTGFAYDHISR